MKAPNYIEKQLGKILQFQGCVFSGKSLDPFNARVYDWKWADCYIKNLDTGEKFEAYQLLIKNDDMKQARWTKPFKGEKLKKS